MRLHLTLHRISGPDRRTHRWWLYWPDESSLGSLHLGRYRIDFGWEA